MYTDAERNFFWSANSESYQDAFLAWLCYQNGTEGETGAFAAYLLSAMLSDREPRQAVKVLEIQRQKYNSDISLLVEADDNEKHLIILENKTGSALHSSWKDKEKTIKYETQLDKYFDKFYHGSKTYRDIILKGNCHLIFYKNEMIVAEEKQKIAECNVRLKTYYAAEGMVVPEWNMYDIDVIYDLFRKFLNGRSGFESEILDSYYQNLRCWQERYSLIRDADAGETDFSVLYQEGFLYEKSWLWHALFQRVSEMVNPEFVRASFVNKYNGNYWQVGFYAEKYEIVFLLYSKKVNVKAKKLEVQVNLLNKRYGDDVPWTTDAKREAAFEAVKKLIDSDKRTNIQKNVLKYHKSEKRESNTVGVYTFQIQKFTLAEIVYAFNETKAIFIQSAKQSAK